ncbi:MAG: hypothetical protein H6600_04790 [Flavobacteriales bacterium]|nr:hypothetical protein [Flavobacteriales bacterium]MCB9197753.1 hypothetical protein [Flavobacteriales bacterium]
MKSKRTISVMMIAFIFAVSSCKKEDEQEKTVSEEETSEVVAKSMESSNSGLIEQIEESVQMANVALQNPICALQYDSTIQKTYTSTSRTLDYTFNWGYQVNCSNNVPSDVTFSYNSSGNYSSLRMDADDEATGSIVLTQLLSSQSSYMANINYERIGNQESNFGNNSTFSSTLTITGSNIEVDKTSYEILGGSANFTISGSRDNGTNYSFSGMIQFLGGGSATVSFNNGNQYTISI